MHTYIISTVTYYCDKILFGEEEYKHDKPKAYTSFNTRFWIADRLKIIKYAEEKSLHAASNLYWYQRKQYDNGLTERKANGGT